MMGKMLSAVAALLLVGSLSAAEPEKPAPPPKDRPEPGMAERRGGPRGGMFGRLNEEERTKLKEAQEAVRKAARAYREDKRDENLAALKAAVNAAYDTRIAVTKSSGTRNLNEQLEKMTKEKETATEAMLKQAMNPKPGREAGPGERGGRGKGPRKGGPRGDD